MLRPRSVCSWFEDESMVEYYTYIHIYMCTIELCQIEYFIEEETFASIGLAEDADKGNFKFGIPLEQIEGILVNMDRVVRDVCQPDDSAI